MYLKRIVIACVTTLLFCAFANAQKLVFNFPLSVNQQLKQTRPDSTRVKLLLEFAISYLDKSVSSPKNIDSALTCYYYAQTLSNQIHLVKWQMECLKFKALYFIKVSDYKQGEESFMKVISYYHTTGNIMIEANNWMEFGDNLPGENLTLFEKKIKCFRHAASLYHQLNNALKETDAEKMVADVHLNQGKLDLAHHELIGVLAKYKSLKYKKLEKTYYLLGAISALKGDLQNELFYSIETIKSMEASADTTDAELYYFKLGSTYLKLGSYANSVIYFKKALNCLPPNDYEFFVDLQEIVQVLIAQHKPKEALAYLQSRLGQVTADNNGRYRQDMCLANCYEALAEYKKAEYYYLRMNRESELDYQRKLNPDESRILDLKRVCDFYILTRQYEKARPFLVQIINHPKKLISTVIFSQIEFIQFKLDSASGNYFSALKHYERHKNLTDSMFSATKSKQIAELMVKFESAKKDKNIQLLEKQSQIENAELEKRRLYGRLSTAGLILLLGFLYSRYAIKQRIIKILKESEKVVTDKNLALADLLKDNEWLLKEIHHRVKNNLHMITGLLHSQSRYITDKTALSAILDSENRVRAMSLIHQKLYKSDNTSNVYMPEYIGELIENLKDSYKTGVGILFSVEVMPIVLEVLIALPIGLILNELITNSIKHAFPNSDDNQIVVRLFTNADEINLYVADNGGGLPEGFTVENTDSFGMILIRGLIDDLGGIMTLETKLGTAFSIKFTRTQPLGIELL